MSSFMLSVKVVVQIFLIASSTYLLLTNSANDQSDVLSRIAPPTDSGSTSATHMFTDQISGIFHFQIRKKEKLILSTPSG